MSERIYSCLLRLYPSWYHKVYGDAALELFRDRMRDERGFRRRTQLWLDLFADLAFSLPWAYSFTEPALTSSAIGRAADNQAFESLESRVPRLDAMVYAAMLSFIAFGLLFVSIGSGSHIRMQMSRTGWPTRSIYRSAPVHPLQQDIERKKTTTSALAQPNGYGSSVTSGDAIPNSSQLSAGYTQPPPLQTQDATTAMIEAISTHQIVMFGETHANKQEYEWLCQLVKTPGFADHVDDIVVEFGNSLYQKSVDRYIAGEDVPFDQVQKAWRNVVGAIGPVSPVYEWFYKAVRESNMQRRDGHKIRLLLGDPYGDWDKIKNAEDLGPYLAHRDPWYAQVVKDEVLSKNHHALLIMGAGHFLRHNGPGEVERAIRTAGIQPYLVVLGTNAVGGYDDLDRRFDSLPLPAIVQLSGNWVGDLPAMPVVTGGVVAANSLKMSDVADAMLYLGPRDSLIQVSVPQSELGTAYGKEVERRMIIQMGRTMEFTQPPEGPQYHRPVQQTVSNGVHLLPPQPPKSINNPLPPRPTSQ